MENGTLIGWLRLETHPLHLYSCIVLVLGTGCQHALLATIFNELDQWSAIILASHSLTKSSVWLGIWYSFWIIDKALSKRHYTLTWEFLCFFSEWFSTGKHVLHHQSSSPFVTSFDVADDFEIGHSFESDTIEILGSIVPDNVGGGSRWGGTPVLDFRHFATPSAVLIFPLPIHASDHAGAGENAAHRDLLRFASRFHRHSLSAWRVRSKRNYTLNGLISGWAGLVGVRLCMCMCVCVCVCVRLRVTERKFENKAYLHITVFYRIHGLSFCISCFGGSI